MLRPAALRYVHAGQGQSTAGGATDADSATDDIAMASCNASSSSDRSSAKASMGWGMTARAGGADSMPCTKNKNSKTRGKRRFIPIFLTTGPDTSTCTSSCCAHDAIVLTGKGWGTAKTTRDKHVPPRNRQRRLLLPATPLDETSRWTSQLSTRATHHHSRHTSKKKLRESHQMERPGRHGRQQTKCNRWQLHITAHQEMPRNTAQPQKMTQQQHCTCRFLQHTAHLHDTHAALHINGTSRTPTPTCPPATTSPSRRTDEH